MRQLNLWALKVPTLAATAVLAMAVVVSSGSAAGPVSILAAAAGYRHTCAITSAHGVVCWGDNTFGQLGDGTTTDRLLPVGVTGLSSGVAAVAAGDAHTCALMSTGHVKCWGRNELGQLGDGSTMSSVTPVNVCADEACDVPLSDVVSISAGIAHTCAITAVSGVKCWGWNESGQLGDGTTTSRSTPGDVPGLKSGIAVVSAGGYHTCALTSAGGVKCWGQNQEGQVGDDRGCGFFCYSPVDVIGLASGVTAVAAGGLHACALTTQGGVLCWGLNFTGQVGDGTSANIRRTPVQVSGLEGGVSSIAANGTFRGHTCALTTSGGLKCWGDNANGQLGDGTATNRLVPADVIGLSNGVVAIAPGSEHTCAIVAPATLKCWGDNRHGQLGDGTTTAHLTAVDVGAKAQPGDVNCDGTTNSIDAALILQFVASLINSLPCLANGDMNHNGTVDAIDAALVLQCNAGLVNCATI